MKTLEVLEQEVKSRPLPQHLAIVMDGNGRWAEARGRPRLEGHREGANSVRDVTRCCRRVGVRALTLYAFSAQNWLRPPVEVAGLMALLADYLRSERSEIIDNNVRLNAIGDLERLPDEVAEPLAALRRDSATNTGMVLTLALSYGGREEIVAAAARLAQDAMAGKRRPEDISVELFEQSLSTRDLPPLDLIIRTSGEKRLSNFLLWQAAYAELVFTEILWPDFRSEAVLAGIAEYQLRQRRYGLTPNQLKHA